MSLIGIFAVFATGLGLVGIDPSYLVLYYGLMVMGVLGVVGLISMYSDDTLQYSIGVDKDIDILDLIALVFMGYFMVHELGYISAIIPSVFLGLTSIVSLLTRR